MAVIRYYCCVTNSPQKKYKLKIVKTDCVYEKKKEREG